jgi:hypothetical protein
MSTAYRLWLNGQGFNLPQFRQEIVSTTKNEWWKKWIDCFTQ